MPLSMHVKTNIKIRWVPPVRRLRSHRPIINHIFSNVRKTIFLFFNKIAIDLMTTDVAVVNRSKLVHMHSAKFVMRKASLDAGSRKKVVKGCQRRIYCVIAPDPLATRKF